jgi:hypothetical protein
VDLAHPLAVVTPTLDGDVLVALALADVSFTLGSFAGCSSGTPRMGSGGYYTG